MEPSTTYLFTLGSPIRDSLHVPYEEVGASVYEAQQRERDLALLQKKASKLGYVLVTPEPT